MYGWLRPGEKSRIAHTTIDLNNSNNGALMATEADLSISISSQISGVLHGDLPLTFTLHYLDTPENRKLIITEIANLYGYFLTQEAHEKEYCSRLRKKGMWLEIKDASGYFPTNKDIDLFIQNLTQCMETDLSTISEYLNESSTKLGMDYGEPGGPFGCISNDRS